jgi:hypothetical protein
MARKFRVEMLHKYLAPQGILDSVILETCKKEDEQCVVSDCFPELMGTAALQEVYQHFCIRLALL